MSYQIAMKTSAGLHQGDIVTMQIRLTLWQRFLIWINRPTRWPPKSATRKFVITGMSSDTSADLDFIRNFNTTPDARPLFEGKEMSKTARDVIAHTSDMDGHGLGDWVAQDVLKGLDAAGFVIVPKEPTEKMIVAGREPSSQFVDGSVNEGGPRTWYLEFEQLSQIYRAMIAAASEAES